MNCANCGKPAKFKSHGPKSSGRWHEDNEHDLCPGCNRDVRNTVRNKPKKDRFIPPFPSLKALLVMNGKE